jgi:hypothetical protein
MSDNIEAADQVAGRVVMVTDANAADTDADHNAALCDMVVGLLT